MGCERYSAMLFARNLWIVSPAGHFWLPLPFLLGASNTVVGLLAAVSPLMQLFQIPAVHLVERAASRKALVVRNSVLSRISWLIIAVIPWLVAPEQRVHVLLMCLFLFFGLGTVSACGYKSLDT